MLTQSNGIDWNGLLQNVGQHLNDWINILAKNLGIAANYLMQIEIKQMYVVGIHRLIWAIFFFALCFASWRIKRHIAKKTAGVIELDGLDWLMVVPIIITLMIGIGFLNNALGHLINPGHYAINDIIDQINALRDGTRN